MFSEDTEFPSYHAVREALKDPKDPESRKTLKDCARLFFYKPATTLNAFVGSLLDKMDSAFLELGECADKIGDMENPEWSHENWLAYCKALLEAFADRASDEAYTATPLRTTSRLWYFLRKMPSAHGQTPFPTKSVINVLVERFRQHSIGVADVSAVCLFY